jgi:ribosome-binding factor A
MMSVEEKVKQIVENMVRDAEVNLTAFKVELERDPHYAFAWSTRAFRASTDLRLAQRLLNEDIFDVNHLRSTLQEELTVKSKYPPASSSATANLSRICETATIAGLLDMLKYC